MCQSTVFLLFPPNSSSLTPLFLGVSDYKDSHRVCGYNSRTRIEAKRKGEEWRNIIRDYCYLSSLYAQLTAPLVQGGLLSHDCHQHHQHNYQPRKTFRTYIPTLLLPPEILTL